MATKQNNPDFGRWAITGVLAPMIVLLVLTFTIAPFFWPEIAAELGSQLGEIFLIYLIVLVVVATAWKIRHDKKGKNDSSCTGENCEK